MDDSEKATLTATDVAHHALPSFQVDKQCKTSAPQEAANTFSFRPFGKP
jgi:hypothetical protein